MAKLVIMVRVKDGIQFVKQWLNCFEKLVDEIVALDNGSTDGTFEILKAHPKVVDIVKTEGYNEGRDKNILYEMTRKRNPDWCLWLDIDEIFEPGVTRSDFDKLMSRRHVNKYGFRRFHFIDPDHFAGSGDYFFFTCIHDRIMWRESPSGYFENFILDSPNVKGIKGVKINSTFRIKHLGYINKDLVDKKVEIYSAILDTNDVPSLNRMYLHNERKIKWQDDRNSVEVKSLNAFLNLKQFLSLFGRGINKLNRVVSKITHKPKIQSV